MTGRPLIDILGGAAPDDPADMGALCRAACDDAIASGRFMDDAAIFRAIASREGRPAHVVDASFRRSVGGRAARGRQNADAGTVRAICRELGLHVELVKD